MHLNNYLNLLFGLANYKPVITQITHPQRNITTALVSNKKRNDTQFWVGMTDIRRANLNMPNIWMETYKQKVSQSTYCIPISVSDYNNNIHL